MAGKGAGEPTLGEAWNTLGQRLGLTVEPHADRSISAHGTVRGRRIDIEIEGDKQRNKVALLMLALNTMGPGSRREKWRSLVTVEIANPRRITGVIESFVDANDPSWKPGQFHPSNGRQVPADNPALALSESVRERLMNIIADVRFEVGPQQITFRHENKARPGPGANFVAGSVLHQFRGTPPPWPEQALIGPPWRIELLCDIADSIDRPEGA